MPRIKVNSTAYFELDPRQSIHTPQNYFSLHIVFKQRNRKMQDCVVFKARGSLLYLAHELEIIRAIRINQLNKTDSNKADRFANAFDRAIAYCKLQHTLLN